MLKAILLPLKSGKQVLVAKVCRHESAMPSRAVMFFATRAPLTGGDMYLAHMCEYIKDRGDLVEEVYLEDMPRFIRNSGLFLGVFLSNFWLLFRLLALPGSRLVLFEDFGFHPRLLLSNLLIRFLRKTNIFMLSQLGLKYHRLTRFGIFWNIDRWLIRTSFARTDIIFTNSKDGRDQVIATGRVNPPKVINARCGFEPIPPAQTGRGNTDRSTTRSETQLLFVGRCSPNKGIQYLLEAVALVSASCRVRLHIVGNTGDDPQYYNHLVEITTARQIAGKVIFHGFVQPGSADLVKLYRQSDIFVLPSIREGFGIVVLEAMSCGLPIITTTADALPELVAHGKTGMLVPPGNAQALADAIATLVDSPDLRNSLGANGRRFCEAVREQYSWPNVCGGIYDVMTRYSKELE